MNEKLLDSTEETLSESLKIIEKNESKIKEKLLFGFSQ